MNLDALPHTVLLILAEFSAGSLAAVLIADARGMVKAGFVKLSAGIVVIAAALALAEKFAAGDPLAVLLGDNLFQHPLRAAIDAYRAEPGGAMIFLKEVPDAHRFGVAELEDGRVTRIVEKPTEPPTDLAVTGCYLFDARVFDYIRSLEPSARGELEITDVNNAYIERGTMTYEILEGWWTDAGTFDSLRRATDLVAETGANLINLPHAEGGK